VGYQISGDCPELAAQLGTGDSVLCVSGRVRRIIYTTNAIESLHSEVRKAVRGRGHFPSDEAATKLIWLALRNTTAKWKNPPIQWHAAKARFAIQFEDRFVMTRG
jgi:putative transposase